MHPQPATDRPVSATGGLSTPRRIQRRRTKGWKMPQGAIYVGRPTRWGNPYQVHGRCVVAPDGTQHFARKGDTGPALAVRLYREITRELSRRDIAELRGHDLACWCDLSAPCHADVLLELANSETP